MAFLLILIFVIYNIVPYYCADEHKHLNQNIMLDSQEEEDPGTPLFLTPYVESDQISEARRLASVPFTENLLQIKSYAGFFTVNKQYNSNQYFWYFPPITPKKKAPVIVWLSGGPGANSVSGVFIENGPLRVPNGTLYLMNYTLSLEHHTIYIDNPVGAGFSFTNNSKGYCTDQIQVGEQLYSSVVQFFKLFPELQENEVFILGISYGGKYAPALAYTIHKKNQQAEQKINLKGVIIGNGMSDPVNQLNYGQYLYHTGLIDWNQLKEFDEYHAKITTSIKNEQWLEAITILNKLILMTNTIFNDRTGFVTYSNVLITDTSKNAMFWDYIPLLPKIRKCLHVGNLQFNYTSLIVFENLKQDIVKSVAPWISELLDYYKVLIYNGQLDIIVPYPLTVNYLRKLNFTGAEEYKTAKRQIWRVDGEVAGYKKKAGNLVEVMVRNAGHMAATDQPKWVLNLVTDFTHGKI